MGGYPRGPMMGRPPYGQPGMPMGMPQQPMGQPRPQHEVLQTPQIDLNELSTKSDPEDRKQYVGNAIYSILLPRFGEA